QLAAKIAQALPASPLPPAQERAYREAPLYVLKGPVDTNGTGRLMSTVKKSGLRFRTHDPKEVPRLSLNEARRQVSGSFGLIAHLLSPNRKGALAHNAQCALIAGIAMAQGKPVSMLQEEGTWKQPIDYRDVVQPYTRAEYIPGLLSPLFRGAVDAMQRT